MKIQLWQLAHKKGKESEEIAVNYLMKQGLKLLEKNYRSRCGEIDLIMQDKDTIVFVEVRARSSSYFGGPLASINRAKQKKLIKTGTFYLLKHPGPARFDVVCFEGTPAKLQWIKNAFDLEAFNA